MVELGIVTSVVTLLTNPFTKSHDPSSEASVPGSSPLRS